MQSLRARFAGFGRDYSEPKSELKVELEFEPGEIVDEIVDEIVYDRDIFYNNDEDIFNNNFSDDYYTQPASTQLFLSNNNKRKTYDSRPDSISSASAFKRRNYRSTKPTTNIRKRRNPRSENIYKRNYHKVRSNPGSVNNNYDDEDDNTDFKKIMVIGEMIRCYYRNDTTKLNKFKEWSNNLMPFIDFMINNREINLRVLETESKWYVYLLKAHREILEKILDNKF